MTPYTVIIPTRERCDVLPHAIETCSRQDYENLRIIVSDNASEDATREVVEDYRKRDSRIEYINPGERVSMSTHWEFALKHVTEGMLLMIGDDDGLMPNAIHYLNSAIKEYPGTLALQRGTAAYVYPELPTPDAGNLILEFETGIEQRNSREWLDTILAGKALYTELPSVYYGCVSAELLDRIRSKTGRLINSMIPDGYIAIAVAASTENFLHLGHPFTITGGSKHSGGFSTNCPGSSPESGRKFLDETDIPFHSDVEFVRSGYVMQGEVCMQAKDKGLISQDQKIDWNRIICRTLEDFHNFDFDPAWQAYEEKQLLKVAEKFGVTQAFEKMKAYLASNRESAPPGGLHLDYYKSPNAIVSINLDRIGAKQVVDASFAADALLEAVVPLHDHYQKKLEREANKTERLRKFIERLRTVHASLADAIERLYRSRRWKLSGWLSSPSRWKKNRTHRELDKALAKVEDLPERLSAIVREKSKD